MGKKIILFLLIFSVSMGALGCAKDSAPGVVVQAEITYEHQGETLYRCYTQPEKLSGFLMLMRLQRFCGYAKVNPEKIAGDRCRIVLTRIDGTKAIILQNAGRFRCRDYRRWEKIDGVQGERLHAYLRDVPGDVSGT